MKTMFTQAIFRQKILISEFVKQLLLKCYKTKMVFHIFSFYILQTHLAELDKIRKAFFKRRGEHDGSHRWDEDVKDSVQTEKFELQCFPLYSILKALNVTTIDFLSLDVEGAEYGILEAAFENNRDWNFNVASIELTYQSTPAFGSSRLEMLYI